MKKNRNTTQWAFFSLFFCICIIGISVAANVGANVYSPTVAPPSDNTPAYINIGDDDQVKAGALRLGTSDDSGPFNYQLEVLGEGALMSGVTVVNNLKVSESTDTLYVDSLNNKVCVGPCVDGTGTKLEVSGGTMSVENSTEIGISSESTGGEAVYGEGLGSSYGVQGFASGLSNYGIWAASTLGTALEGLHVDSLENVSSVAGFSDTGFGIYGTNNNLYGLWAGYFDGIVESNSDVSGAKFLPTQLQISLIPFTSGQVSDSYDVSGAVVKRFDGAYLWLANDNVLTKVRASDGLMVLEDEVVSSPATITDVLYDGVYVWVAADIQDAVVKVNPQTGAHDCSVSLNSPKSIAFDGMTYWITAEDGSGNGILVNVDGDCTTLHTTQLVDSDYTLGKVIFNGKYLVILATHTASVEDDGYVINVNPSRKICSNDSSVCSVDDDCGGGSCWQANVMWENLVGNLPADIFFDNYYYWVTNSADGTISRFYMSSAKYCSIEQVGNRVACGNDGDCSAAGLGACFAFPEPYGLFNMSNDPTHALDEPSLIQFDGTHIWVLNRWIDSANVMYDELVGMYAFDPTIIQRTALTDAVGGTISPTGMVFDGTDLWLSSSDGLKRAYSGTGFGFNNLEQTLQLQTLDVSGLTRQEGSINISGSGRIGVDVTADGELSADNNVWGDAASGTVFISDTFSNTWIETGIVYTDLFVSTSVEGLIESSNGQLFASVYNTGDIYRYDGGSWVVVGTANGMEHSHDLLEAADGTFYMAGEDDDPSYDEIIFKSTDRGANWIQMSVSPTGKTDRFSSLVQAQDGALYATGQGDIFKLNASTEIWERIFTLDEGATYKNYPFYDIFQASDGTFYFGSKEGGADGGFVYVSTDNGATWSSVGNPNPGPVIEAERVLSFVEGTDGYVYAGTGGNGKVYRTNNYGADWEDVGDSNLDDVIQFNTMTRASNGNLYAAAGGYGISQGVFEYDYTSWADLGSLGAEPPVDASLDLIQASDGALYVGTGEGGGSSRVYKLELIGLAPGTYHCNNGQFVMNVSNNSNNEVTRIECRAL